MCPSSLSLEATILSGTVSTHMGRKPTAAKGAPPFLGLHCVSGLCDCTARSEQGTAYKESKGDPGLSPLGGPAWHGTSWRLPTLSGLSHNLFWLVPLFWLSSQERRAFESGYWYSVPS